MKQWTARLLAAGLLFPAVVFGQTFVQTPDPVGYVNDFADFIDDGAEAKLEQQLIEFEEKTTHEISVVTTDSLQQTTIEDLAVRWFEQWKIGKAEEDNGVLLLIVPSERVMRIEVGYGLEGAITDSQAQAILNNVLTPAFQSDDADGGIFKAVGMLMSLASGEEVDLGGPKDLSPMGVLMILFAFVILLAIISFVVSWANKGGKGKGKKKRRDSFYDADGGFWSDRGGSSGGGFGGFGGGGSGGGGASGSW